MTLLTGCCSCLESECALCWGDIAIYGLIKFVSNRIRKSIWNDFSKKSRHAEQILSCTSVDCFGICTLIKQLICFFDGFFTFTPEAPPKKSVVIQIPCFYCKVISWAMWIMPLRNMMLKWNILTSKSALGSKFRTVSVQNYITIRTNIVNIKLVSTNTETTVKASFY